jgi:hypothetical protein
MESAAPDQVAPQVQQVPAAGRVRKQGASLKRLIKEASRGQSDEMQTLLRPFVSEEEEFVSWGISSRLGLIPRYNFYFLTDRRVGDLEITPLTGNFNVEMAYLHKIDAVAIRQPSLILMRLALLALYALVIAYGVAGAYIGFTDEESGIVALSVAGAVAGVLLVRFVFSPAIRRIFLRFRKSGMFLKLTGGSDGTYILADRNKMTEMSGLSRQITDLKRTLDLDAA